MGHLVHSILLLVVQIGLLVDDDIDNDECVVIPQVVLDIFYPIYCFFQLFFIYKYSNVIIIKWQVIMQIYLTPLILINYRYIIWKWNLADVEIRQRIVIVQYFMLQGLARFAFMHFIGSSLCFWIWAIVRETLLAITLYAQMLFKRNETETTTVPSTSIYERNYIYVLYLL